MSTFKYIEGGNLAFPIHLGLKTIASVELNEAGDEVYQDKI